MWYDRSSRLRTAQGTRLCCEFLEGRLLLNAMPVLPIAVPPGPGLGHYSMAVSNFNGDGPSEFVYSSEDTNRVWMNLSGGAPNVLPGVQPIIQDPTAIALGDLNGDGIDDLIVCQGDADRVFIFLGLGEGLFGPELNGGTGLPTGVSPDAVTVTPPENGTGPELVVADKGSNDVAIFQGQDTASGWNLVEKERAHVGPDPTSVLVQDVIGDIGTDLVVTNGGNDTVSILPGTGQGLFDDHMARVLPTGNHPVQALVGNFDGRLDLVTVDSGSNDVTFFSDVASPNTVGMRIPTGGIDPVAALALDTKSNGRSDLVVANYGDGRLTLFSGTSSGLLLTKSLQETGQYPTALAVAEGMPLGSFYVLNAGQDSATLRQFDTAETTLASATPAASIASATTPSGPLLDEELGRTADWLGPGRTVGTDLQPLTPTAAAVIPGVALRTDLLQAAPGAVGQVAATEEERQALLARGEPLPALIGDEPPSVQRFIIGVDQVPAPRIGPDGASIEDSLPVPLPEVRPAASPVMVHSPTLPMREASAPVVTELVSAAETNVESEESSSGSTDQPRSTSTLLALAAFGLLLGWRWQEEDRQEGRQQR